MSAFLVWSYIVSAPQSTKLFRGIKRSVMNAVNKKITTKDNSSSPKATMGVKNLRTEWDADNRFNIANTNRVGCFYCAPQKASLYSPRLQKLFWCHHFNISYFMQAQWGPWELALGLLIAGGRLGRDHFNEAREECLRSPCDQISERRGWRLEG